MNRPKVVILGGGFGGLAAARALYKDADVTVVVVITTKPSYPCCIRSQPRALPLTMLPTQSEELLEKPL